MLNPRHFARNYLIRFGLAVIVYTLTLLVALPIARRMGDNPARHLVACLPVIGVALGIWAIRAIVAEVDEMQSRKLQAALTFSLALTILVSFAFGMMQSVGMPAVNWLWVTVVWGGSFGIGIVYETWRYR